MIVSIVPLSSLQFEKVHYYTVRFENRTNNEFKDFIARMNADKRDQLGLAEINRYIEKIGQEYGAHPRHFRDEDAADGLPPPYHQFVESEDVNDFGIRLYCLRLSSSIVLLINGDRKTSLKVKDCKKCYPHFFRAGQIAKKINQAILEGFIELDHEKKEINVDEDFDLTI